MVAFSLLDLVAWVWDPCSARIPPLGIEPWPLHPKARMLKSNSWQYLNGFHWDQKQNFKIIEDFKAFNNSKGPFIINCLWWVGKLAATIPKK